MAPEQLISAIRAALDETERIAREAAETAQGETWQLDDLGCCLATDEAGVILSAEMGWTDPKPAATHIVHNDPAAVLRRVAADREIVDAYEQAINDNRYGIAEVCDEYRYAILPALARGLGINPEEN